MRYATEDEGARVAEVLAEAARRMAALRGAPPFRVFAATGPAPEPAWFAEGHRRDDVWQRITVRHGRSGQDEAALWVTSAVRDAAPVSLAESLRLERDGYPRADEDPSAREAGAGRMSRAEVVVGGAPRAADVLTEGTWWAARIEAATDTDTDADADAESVTVTVVGHQVPIGQVRLATVTDLGPYLDAREAELARRRA
ncbi:hypothetical protein [Streptomyces sp. NPDC008139]|uniref:hypothetical protein n=1 Tax=Streptomyces sp. NPDC008139 TaxID=3364814 RepID=UPI0036E722AF